MKAVCSIIGHTDVYDVDIQSKMQAAVDQLVAEHETVEFLVYPNGALSSAFLLAALRARTNCPQKITISFVSLHGVVERMGSQDRAYFYISDQLVIADIQVPKTNDGAILYKKMLLWITQNSTHIISYFYDMLYDPDRQLVKHARMPDISLSTPETETAILEAAVHMTEKEQIIFQKMNEGCTLQEAGGAIGVGKERARQILLHGCRTIRTGLMRRRNRALAAEGGPQKRTCGLFALGEATYDSLTIFKRTIHFLLSTYDISDIFVEQSYVRSPFIFELVGSAGSASFMGFRGPHITALVRGGVVSEDDNDLDAVKTMLCPPCQAVGYISRADSSDFDVIAEMIERTNFCIYNSSATPYADKIRKCAAQTKQTVLLDISGFGEGSGTVRKREDMQ